VKNLIAFAVLGYIGYRLYQNHMVTVENKKPPSQRTTNKFDSIKFAMTENG